MATIPLRDYCREIENMIDKGHTDEAIGHCRHILKHFPKHIATYRLLGKAYLESKQLGDAADIFQRVLSTIPEDFVSHIGMSIIREDEGNIDAALWHMERAYEVQPSNIAIQDELKRIYTQRDGQEPAKIRLTRGALAHMYANGHLYAQAIAELRVALSTDPKRLDLQTLLGKMYHADRQQANAAKTASQLLNKLPFSLAANQILAEILTANQRANEAVPHRTRLQELDPYYKHVSAQSPNVDAVPSGMVVLEVLDWEATKGGLISQPAWATSIGVDISNAPASEALPEWFSPAMAEGGSSAKGQEQNSVFEDISFDDQLASFASSALQSNSAREASRPQSDENAMPSLENNLNEAKNMREEDDNLPDWMKSAGWSPRDPNTPEDPPAPLFDDEEEASTDQGGIAKADIPEWLRAMAPPDASSEENTEATSDDLPDWLQGFNTAETAPTRIPPSRPETAWTPPRQTPTPPPTSASPDLPDWLRDEEPSAPTPSSAAPAEKADMPDWLKDLNPTSAEPEEDSGADWMGIDAPKATPTSFDLNDLEESTAPDWLQDFGDEVVSSTLPSAKKEPTMPSWLAEEEESPAPSETSAEEDIFAQPDAAPAGLSWLDEVNEEEQDDPSLHSGVTDWLSDISSSSEDALHEAVPAADIPDWLKGLGEEESADLFAEEEEPAPSAETTAPSFDMGDLGKDASQDFGLEDDAMAWLEALAAKQGAKEEELLTNRESREDTHLPSWLEEMTEEETAEPATTEENMVPDWLKGMEEADLEPAQPVASMFEEEEPAPTFEEEVIPPTMEVEEPEEAPAMPSVDDSDAAMAWLEALAAKQGAKEEELLTAPTERSEDIPDWLKGILDVEEEPISPLEETAISDRLGEFEPEEPAALEEAPEPEAIFFEEETVLEEEAPLEVEAPETSAPETEAAMMDEDAALAWLESLAMKHGVNEAELLTDAEKRPEGTPDWVNAVAEEARAEEAAAEQQLESELDFLEEPVAEVSEPADAGWLADLVEEEEVPAPEAEEETAPDWLTDSAANWITSVADEAPVEEPEAEEPAAQEAEELPAWLMEEEPPAEPAPEMPSWILEEPAEPTAPAIPDVPSWLLEEPSEESVAEEADITSWLGLTQEDTAKVEEIRFEEPAAPELELEPEPEPAPVWEPEPEPEPAAPVWEPEPEPEPERVSEAPMIVVDAGEALTTARTSLARGEVATAADHYARLIKSNQNVDEAIADITEALNTRYPVDIDLWCSLGDAYVKKNKLQDALDAYTKAEELLR